MTQDALTLAYQSRLWTFAWLPFVAAGVFTIEIATAAQEVHSVSELMEAYENGRHYADLQFNGTRVRVKDRVAKIAGHDIILRPGDSGDYVKCQLGSVAAENVTVGSEIMVEGVGR